VTKVLIIDDSLFTLNYYSRILRQKGCQVFSAENGEDGIKLFCSEEPDIVLCDLMMPSMDGFEVLEEVKKLSNSVFFFITADIQEGTREKALGLGATGVIAKPLTEEAADKVLEEYGN
jgi:CheY-like chemotaxis protein